jgi:hypothetical protein
MSETFAQKLTKKVQQAQEAQNNDHTGTAIKLYEEVIKEPIVNKVDDLKEETIKAKNPNSIPMLIQATSDLATAS